MAGSTITKILSIVLFLVMISKGYSQITQCSFKEISVSQHPTGVKVQGKPEWSVTITNNCCVQRNVYLNCVGFHTVENIDPSILSIKGDKCLLNAGQFIYRDAINFKYAWDQSFPLNPISSEVACS